MATTLLIALDGATYTILEPMMADGTMPFLNGLVRGGAHGVLMSTDHPLTPPAFTTMITGRSPGRHGLLDFIKGEDDGNEVFFTLYDARDNQCETLWSIANRQNRKVMALNFVMSTPVTPVCGYIVPGMTHWKHLRRHTHPPEFYEKLKAQPWFDPKVMCWDFDHMEKAITSKPEMSSADWVRDHIGRERQWFQVMRFLMKKDPADLMAIVFDGVDKVQHVCWDLMDPATRPAHPDAEQTETLGLIAQYFSELDGFLRELVELAGPCAQTFIVSDHGFGPFYLTVRLNQFLHEQGLLFWKDGEGVDAEGLNLDWERTVAYCPTQSSNGIFIRVADKPGRIGIAPERYHEVRNQLIAKLRELRDPLTGEPVVTKVLPREEYFAGPGMKRAPDITLVLAGPRVCEHLARGARGRTQTAGEGHALPEGRFHRERQRHPRGNGARAARDGGCRTHDSAQPRPARAVEPRGAGGGGSVRDGLAPGEPDRTRRSRQGSGGRFRRARRTGSFERGREEGSL